MSRIIIHAINHIGLGHISRTLTVANWLLQNDSSTEILFLVEDESKLFDDQPFPWIRIPSVHDFNLPSWDKVTNQTKKAIATNIISGVIKEFKPELIIYDTVLWEPVLYSAHIFNLKQILIARLGHFTRQFFTYAPDVINSMDSIILPHDPDELTEDESLIAKFPTKLTISGTLVKKSSLQVYPEKMRAKYNLSENTFNILLTVGGGGWREAAIFLKSAVETLNQISCQTSRQISTVVVTGPHYANFSLPDNLPNFQVVQFEPDLMDLMAASNLVICQCGYNTMNEAVEIGVPTICVPTPEADDQVTRARQFAAKFPNICESNLTQLHAKTLAMLKKPLFRFVLPEQPSQHYLQTKTNIVDLISRVLAI